MQHKNCDDDDDDGDYYYYYYNYYFSLQNLRKHSLYKLTRILT